MPKPILTQKRLKELFSYNPETGDFTRTKTRSHNARKGDVAGSNDGAGYIRISIDKAHYRAHRLAWLYVHGKWPNEIDHINHNRSDNRIINLREVVRHENAKNASFNSANTSGVTGVSWNKRAEKWEAYISDKTKRIKLGMFDSLIDATLVRERAEWQYGYHKNHGD